MLVALLIIETGIIVLLTMTIGFFIKQVQDWRVLAEENREITDKALALNDKILAEWRDSDESRGISYGRGN